MSDTSINVSTTGKGKYEHRLLEVNQKFALCAAVTDHPIGIPGHCCNVSVLNEN